MTESAIKDKIMKYLASRPGAFFWRAGAGMYAKSGIADIIGCYRGQFVAFEVKTPEAYKKPDYGMTHNQLAFGRKVLANGGSFACVENLMQTRIYARGI